ncbi:LLM class flavin-dependent oxidoreductase [Phytohabitans suffuscus]|uniref:Oxidoreductase n=1 Tax=Phytohabitans suffuscus TaxID=624315 RepID=A0A6F8YUV3_9ACTN|nr:LLM class flavin-dependent oxidoreductase [Phytohabitans suffuscus]BCB89718.1 oxidoreductase [Phytohabitans suffuscus]
MSQDTAHATMPVLYATFPSSAHDDVVTFSGELDQLPRWCDSASYRGALIYTDNSLMDPWVVAQESIRRSPSFVPLVAIQPLYQHPFAVARTVASIASLRRRRVDLNFVTGGFKADLVSLGDDLDHDRRYDRLVEYADVVRALLAGSRVTYAGAHYRLESAKVRSVPADLRPGFFVSGSSPSCRRAAKAIGAVRLCYPPWPDDAASEAGEPGTAWGMRVGIIARDDRDDAWAIAETRFPPDARGVGKQRIISRMSESSWQRKLSQMAEAAARAGSAGAGDGTYWLRPFQSYKTFCPYLVGSYDEVAGALQRYLAAGVSTIILDVPTSYEDLVHARLAIARAVDAAPLSA